MSDVGDVGDVGDLRDGRHHDVLAAESWAGLEALYRQEQPGLVRLASLMVRDQAVAEEIVQEAFVRIHSKLDRVDQPGDSLRTIVVNLCRGHGRRVVTAERHQPSPVAVAPEPSVPDELSPVWLALADLPDRQRHALVLRFCLDLPDTEIARLLDARPGTARSPISQGLTALKELVSP